MKGRQQLRQSKASAVRGDDTALPSTKLCDSSSQQQCESNSGGTGSPSTKLGDCSSQQQCESKIGVSLDKVKSGDTGSPSTKLGDCSSQQQCESKIGVRLDQGTLASFFTSPAQSRCKDQSVAGEARKIGADRKKAKQPQQNRPEELGKVLRELPSWDSEDLPFEALLRVVTPGAEICSCQHCCQRGMHDFAKGASGRMGTRGSPNPRHWVLLTSGVFAGQTNRKRVQLGAIDPSDTGCWEPRQPVGIRNFGNTCYLNTALQAIAPMLTEAACVVSWVPSGERESLATRSYSCLRDATIHSFPFSNIRMSSSVMSSRIFHDYVDRKIRTQSAMNEDLHTVVTRLHEWKVFLLSSLKDAEGT
eukprot:g5089.t1